MLYIEYLIIVNGQNIKKNSKNSIAFSKSTSQRIYPEECTHGEGGGRCSP